MPSDTPKNRWDLNVVVSPERPSLGLLLSKAALLHLLPDDDSSDGRSDHQDAANDNTGNDDDGLLVGVALAGEDDHGHVALLTWLR